MIWFSLILLAEIRSCSWKRCWSVHYVTFRNVHQDNFVCPKTVLRSPAAKEKMSEPVISGAASQKFPFWIRSGSLGGFRPGRRKKDYASRAHTKVPNSRTLRSIPFCVAARENSTKKINDIPIRLPPWVGSFVRTSDKLAIDIDRFVTQAVELQFDCLRLHSRFASTFLSRSRGPELCCASSGILKTKTSGWWRQVLPSSKSSTSLKKRAGS